MEMGKVDLDVLLFMAMDLKKKTSVSQEKIIVVIAMILNC